MGTRYNRPAGAYAGGAGLANRTKYADDAVAKVAISSAKVDGDLNYVVDALNDIDDARGAASSVAARLDVSLNADGTLKSGAVAVLDDWVPVATTGLTRVGDATIRLSGDQRAKLPPDRRVRVQVGGVFLYGDVASCELSGSQTTVGLVSLVDAAGVLAVIGTTPTALAVGPLVPGVAGNMQRRVDSLRIAGYRLTDSGGDLGIIPSGGSTAVVRVNAGGLSGLAAGSVSVSALAAAVAEQLVPVGGVLPYAGATAPTGWVLCAGQVLSRVTFANLFGVIGTTYGAGDGSTTFGVPDLRGRVVFGRDNMNGTAANRLTSAISGVAGTTLGAAGGDERLHAHTHVVIDPGHTHSESTYVGTAPGAANGGAASGNAAATTTGSATTGITLANSGAGSGQNVPPALVLNYVMKA